MIEINGRDLTLDDIRRIRRDGMEAALSEDAAGRVLRSRGIVERVDEGNEPYYGINTGFGPLRQVMISPEDKERLQENLVLSHAVGVGEAIPASIARLMLLLKANSFAKGFSGVRLETVERLLDFYNRRIIPVIPNQGSVGASGDLAPLAHMVLPMIGRGEVDFKGKRQAAAKVLADLGMRPLILKSKEGLALINGTQFMSAHGVVAVLGARRLAKTADIVAAMTLEALKGSASPFDERLHATRPHAGAIDTAYNMVALLAESEILKSHENCPKVQDPYSVRCVPQVHGATRDALSHAASTLEIEINAATDNPVVLEDGTIISGGNFHGQPLALTLDYLTMALSELANISERRLALLISGHDGLPPLLMEETGLNSGFMLPQYTAAALVSENKVLSTPACVDSIPTSLGFEDHVSMGSISARKACEVLKNVETVLSIELMCAAQALDYRGLTSPGRGVATAHRVVRKYITHTESDRLFQDDIKAALALVRKETILQAVEKETGVLR